ncbi:MAG TPA: YkuS family protein [Firmicutes bacterium]|nr:YkuS family protein [Bacillota bacterium]
MPKGIIAVAEGLTNVGVLLEREGYAVVGIDGNLGRVDAVVTSGVDTDMSGVSAIFTKAPVIDVAGKSPREVLQAVEETIAKKRL